MSVIEKILKLMEEKQITARKLTTELELANSSVSEWKKGKAKPSLEAVVKIAKYFGVTTDFLLLQESDKQERPVSESEKPFDRNPFYKDTTDQCTAVQKTSEQKLIEQKSEEQIPSEQRTTDQQSAALTRDFSAGKTSEEMTYLRNYRSHVSPGVRLTMELSNDEVNLLECYKRLDEEDKEYIRCKMVVMKRESVD